MTRLTGDESKHWHDESGNHRMPDPARCTDLSPWADAPICDFTSYSGSPNPRDHGIDPDSQWWASACVRPRRRDVLAEVHRPGQPYTPVVAVVTHVGDRPGSDEVRDLAREALELYTEACHWRETGEVSNRLRELLPSWCWPRLREWRDSAHEIELVIS